MVCSNLRTFFCDSSCRFSRSACRPRTWSVRAHKCDVNTMLVYVLTICTKPHAHVIYSYDTANNLTSQTESAPLKNLIVHSIIIVYKLHSTNSGFVAGWRCMPSSRSLASVVKNSEWSNNNCRRSSNSKNLEFWNSRQNFELPVLLQCGTLSLVSLVNNIIDISSSTNLICFTLVKLSQWKALQIKIVPLAPEKVHVIKVKLHRQHFLFIQVLWIVNCHKKMLLRQIKSTVQNDL